MSKYGRPIVDPAEELNGVGEAPMTSGDSFWRRWWAGGQVAIIAPLCLQLIIRIRDAVGFQDWSSDFLRGVVAVMLMLFVFVGIPVMTYEIAYLAIVRPWRRKQMRNSSDAAENE